MTVSAKFPQNFFQFLFLKNYFINFSGNSIIFLVHFQNFPETFYFSGRRMEEKHCLEFDRILFSFLGFSFKFSHNNISVNCRTNCSGSSGSVMYYVGQNFKN